MSTFSARSTTSRLSLVLALGLCAIRHASGAGAEMPWSTYEAEAMKNTGTVLGPKYDPYLVETESSGEKCVKLTAAGQYVEFTARASADAIVVRYSLPDSTVGGGTDTSLGLFVNGKKVGDLALTSRYSRLYGDYPFSNDPQKGKPRNFYDELRVKDLAISAGDTVRLQRTVADTEYCILDLVDLENAPAALSAPASSLSIVDFGADPRGSGDSTEALRKCITAAQGLGRTVWVPAGDYRITGEIRLPSSTTIQGAGMWHTTFVGDPELYRDATRRIRFTLKGSDIHLADFSIVGKLNYRNDNEPNDGIVGAGCDDCSITGVWIEHTKTGTWIYNGSNLRITGCRYRNLLADGVNLCVGTYNTVIENCTTRGTGDDCFAIWPAASDQGFVGKSRKPGNNVIRRCTGQLPFLANGGAIYGGESNRIEDCLFADITAGSGILISTTFPTSDAALNIDNNFSGTTVVRNCRLLRCGGYDHDWAWRAALQVCLDHRSISGLSVRQVDIRDSFSDGISIVTPPNRDVHPSLSSAVFENVTVSGYGLATRAGYGLIVGREASGGLALVGSKVGKIRIDSPSFSIQKN